MPKPTGGDFRTLLGDLGDIPVGERARVIMNGLARFLDFQFNGQPASADAETIAEWTKNRDTGFVLMVFPFNSKDGSCNYITNSVAPADVALLMKRMAAELEGQPQQSGTA